MTLSNISLLHTELIDMSWFGFVPRGYLLFSIFVIQSSTYAYPGRLL